MGKNLCKLNKQGTKMSSNSNTEPAKGILKHTHTPDDDTENKQRALSASTEGHQNVHAHFDEKNILQTYHPAGKEYGHMKIEEPNTPYHVYLEPEDDKQGGGREKVKRSSVDYNQASVIDPDELTKKLLQKEAPKATLTNAGENERKGDEFKAKRASHYGKEFVKRSELPPDED